MSSVIRMRKNLLGQSVPNTVGKAICDLLNDAYFSKIVLRTIYQRNIRWNPVAMNDFVATVMDNGLVPGIIMYRLHNDEKIGKNEGKSYEMVDGQHRVFTLKAFVESTYQILPHISKPFIVFWQYKNTIEDGTFEYLNVFYRETADVLEWCRENKVKPLFLSDEEKEHFDHFIINVTIINEKISLEQRREMFMSLQKGIPVRNSDFLKNKTDNKLIAFLSENNYEEMMNHSFLEHCYKKASNYWIHWVCRCFFLFKRFNGYFEKSELNIWSVSEIFLMEDKKFKKLIDINSPELNPRNIDIIHEFDDTFRTFIEFLKKSESKLNPTQIFAMFYILCDSSKDLDIISTHIPYISREGYLKENRTMWESKDKREPRRLYFDKCLEQFNSITERALPFDDRQISKTLKKIVWKKCLDNKCEICEDEISEDQFEAGHIVARAIGGQINIDNLIPICFTCNRSMGIRNAYEYKRDTYPHLCVTTVEEAQEL